MATTGKSTTHKSLSGQNDTSTCSKTQDSEKNSFKPYNLVTHQVYKATEIDGYPSRVVIFRFIKVNYYDGDPVICGVDLATKYPISLFPHMWDFKELTSLELELI